MRLWRFEAQLAISDFQFSIFNVFTQTPASGGSLFQNSQRLMPVHEPPIKTDGALTPPSAKNAMAGGISPFGKEREKTSRADPCLQFLEGSMIIARSRILKS